MSREEMIPLDGFHMRKVKRVYDMCHEQFDALDAYEQSFITGLGDILELAEQFGSVAEVTRRQWNFIHHLDEKYKETSL